MTAYVARVGAVFAVGDASGNVEKYDIWENIVYRSSDSQIAFLEKSYKVTIDRVAKYTDENVLGYASCVPVLLGIKSVYSIASASGDEVEILSFLDTITQEQFEALARFEDIMTGYSFIHILGR